MLKKTSLLEKYMIPIEHLDYEYVRNCKNVEELEKVIEILKSGEEGFYPDLIKFTVSKLSELDPENRMLRVEVPCKRISIDQSREINDFMEKIKVKDRHIRQQIEKPEENDCTPPIRALSLVNQGNSIQRNNQRIKSNDYANWDKYDADTECLKIELQEERNREAVLIQEMQKVKLIELHSEELTFGKFNEIEKQELADKFRLKGNENFKCSNFSHALSDYTKSLEYFPTVAVYNNRALTCKQTLILPVEENLKLKEMPEAINDCDECLRLDPNNVKAMLRKCDALIAINKKNDAYKIYSQILRIDPNNVVAKTALKDISIRLQIQDINNGAHKTKSNIEHSTTEQTIKYDDNDDDDLPQLIIPKKIVQSKLINAMKNMNLPISNDAKRKRKMEFRHQ